MKKIFVKEFKIGLWVIVAAIVLIFGIEYLKGLNLFSSTHYYTVMCENVQGLDMSAPVTINGFKVGQVRDIKYNFENPGKVEVVLSVDKKLELPVGSYAMMCSTLMSGNYIELYFGKGSEKLSNGSELPMHQNKDMMSAIQDEVLPAVGKIMPRIDSLLVNLNNIVTDPALIASIQRLDGITTDVKNITGGLGNTVNKDLPPVMRNARYLTARLDSVSDNLVTLSNTLNGLPLNSTMDNVNKITDDLARFSAKLNDKNSTLGLLTTDPELYNRLNRVSADIDSLIVDIKKNPKRYISIKLF